jgi:hypothetical protein
MWPFIFVTVCFYERKRSCACFLIVDICLAVGYPITKRGRVGISFIGLTPPYCCSWPNPGPWSATWRSDFVLLILTVLWWQVIVRFVDIGGIVYHHYLHVLLILVELFTIIVYTFCWYWWNCLPSLFTRFIDIGGISYHHCIHVLLILVELFTIIVYTFCWYWWNCLPSLFTRLVDIGGIVYNHCLHVLLILVELFTIIVYTFCWYWWNCLPSLFTRFVDIGGIVYHHCLFVLLILLELFIIIVYAFCWYWWNCLPSLFTFFVHNHTNSLNMIEWVIIA